MEKIDQKEYQTVILAALLHVFRSRFFGDAGKIVLSFEFCFEY